MNMTNQTIGVGIAIFVAVSLVPVFADVHAQEFLSEQKTISVTGISTSSVEPDLLVIQFGVDILEKTAL